MAIRSNATRRAIYDFLTGASDSLASPATLTGYCTNQPADHFSRNFPELSGSLDPVDRVIRSYREPIAVRVNGQWRVTARKWSVTTTNHTNTVKAELAYV